MIRHAGTPPLDDAYLAACETRARQFQGTWDQGTSGTLAADLFRVLRDRARILAAHHQEPAMPDTHAPHGLAGKSPIPDPEDFDTDDDNDSKLALELAHAAAAEAFKPYAKTRAVRPPSEALLLEAAATVADRRQTYGPCTDHFTITIGLLNAAFAHKLRARLAAGLEPFELTDWPLIMSLDKVARYMGPGRSPDCAVDLAGYAGCLRECEPPKDH